MDNTALTVLFACAGVAYFMFIKPALQNAQEMQKLQTEKLNSLPSEADVAKAIDASIATLPTTNDVASVDKKIDDLIAAVVNVNQDLTTHVEDESVNNDRQIELMEAIHIATIGIEAVVDTLILELSKNNQIAPINKDDIANIKNAAMNMQQDVSRMLSYITQQMAHTPRSRHTKLNRVMNTRV